MAEEQAAPSLRDAIDSAVEEVVVPETPPTQEVVTSEPTTTEQPPVEEVAGEKSTTPVTEEEIKEEVPTFGDKNQDRPPASWKGDAKKVWSELPEAARSEVTRRERQVDQVLAQTAEARQIADSVKSIATQYSDSIQRFGVPPAQVFQTLLEADRKLATSDPVTRAQFMAQLIHDYKVDIVALDSALAGKPIQASAQGDVSAQVKALLAQELAPFKQRLQADEQAMQEQVSMTIAEMQNDHVNFPYFEDVREDMADLIELRANRGVYITMQQAYNVITGGNPTVQAAQRTTQQRSQALDAHATAQRAKGAAVSVGGTPASVSGGIDPTNLRGTIEAALDGSRV
jgi:hypothetical protein